MTTSKKMEDDWEKMEDDHKKIKWKTTSQEKWKTTSKNKMKDEPINQNQPGCDTIVNSPNNFREGFNKKTIILIKKNSIPMKRKNIFVNA